MTQAGLTSRQSRIRRPAIPRGRPWAFGLRPRACGLLIVLALWVPRLAFPADPAAAPVQTAELSPETERAIESGLQFLAKRQNADGSWGGRYKVACTALNLMAFMLKGHFPEDGPYGDRLDRAVGFLIQQASETGGYMGVNMYEHGLATLALSEAWGMSQREEVRDALKRAVGVILRAQSPRGGWRYQPRPQDADISVTVMQIVALTSAKEAGIHVPARTIERALRYVKSLQVKPGGGFGYQSPSNPGFPRSAAGVMSLLMAGERDSKEAQLGLEYLRRFPAHKFTSSEYYFYAHYYAVQAMYQAGEASYQEWYPKVRDAMLARQRKDGSWIGEGEEGDPAYATAMAILTLGVPYRYLPIYQR